MKLCEYCKTNSIKERTDRKVQFCSISCANKSRRTNFPRPCQYCKNDFQPPRSNPKQKYCGLSCRDKARSLKQTVSCSWCGNPVVRRKDRVKKLNNSFCNKKCETAWRKKYDKRGKFHPQYVERGLFYCETCGEEIYRLPSRVKKYIFCCKECRLIWQRYSGYSTGSNNACWRGGHSDYRGANWPKQRIKALKRDSFCCQNCNSKDDLQVHHIVGYALFDDYKEANHIDNLITLCNTCHTTVEWVMRNDPFTQDLSFVDSP